MVKPPQLSIVLSLVALVLALTSVVMQLDWNRQDPETTDIEEQKPDQGASGEKALLADLEPASADDTSSSKPSDVPNPLEEKIARLERQLDRLQRLVRASGLDYAAPAWGSYPEGPGPIFEQLGREAADRVRFETRREELTQQAAEIRDKDYLRYGPEGYRELEELYRSARPGRGAETDEQRGARTQALNRMIDEFPDAYETGVAIAEQALREALDGNTEEVESHLQTLLETSPHRNIVTEQGMEATPTIQTFLARQYIEQDRIEEASSLLNQLAENYPDSLIVEPSPGNAPSSPRTALEIATELQQQLGSEPSASMQ